MQIVLHLGLKLEYFHQHDWEDECIDVAENLVHKEYIDAYENQTVLGEDSLVNDAEVCSPFFMICLHDAICSVQDNDDGLGGFSNISVGKKASHHNKLNQYLGLTVENVKDPSKLWLDNCMDYPNLSHMALDYLSIPGEYCSSHWQLVY